MLRISRTCRPLRGGILLTVLVFAVVIATMLGGLGTLIVSYYSRVTTESYYASVINLADAGANYELRKLNQNVNNADLPGSSTPPGTTVSFGSGTFRVYCTMSDGQTSWDKQAVPFCIISTGTIGAVSRGVKIKVTTAIGSAGTAGLFAVVEGDTSLAHGVPEVIGSVATDGTLDFTGNPTVTGQVLFYGPDAGWSPVPGDVYSCVYSPNEVVWPTTTAVALSLFPNSGATAPGGLTYLSTHNDNTTSSPAVTGNSVTVNGNGNITFVGKPGGSNYYVTSMTTGGNSTVTFNNTNGPITIWQGTASGTITLNGGVAEIPMSTDPTKPVKIYAASTGGITLNGKDELDAGVYNVTDGTATTTLNGNATINGTVICDEFTFNGNTTINTTTGYFTPSGSSTYVFGNSWVEQNGF